MVDMLWVSEGGHAMLLREGDYPPLRAPAHNRSNFAPSM